MPNIEDLEIAILWLQNYEDNEEGDPAAAACRRVAAWLERQVASKEKNAALSEGVRDLSQKTGIDPKVIRARLLARLKAK